MRNTEGRSLGALPDGSTLFGMTATSLVQIIVTADGRYWGYAELKPSENVPAADYEKSVTAARLPHPRSRSSDLLEWSGRGKVVETRHVAQMVTRERIFSGKPNSFW